MISCERLPITAICAGSAKSFSMTDVKLATDPDSKKWPLNPSRTKRFSVPSATEQTTGFEKHMASLMDKPPIPAKT